MPPASKKNCSVILFDLKAKNREKAVQTLLKISCYNSFSSSKDLTVLILVNSTTTKNRLAARHGGYEHIEEVTEVGVHNPRLFLEKIEQSETGDANWLEALAVGAETLIEDYESIGGIVTYQLLFITDLDSAVPPQHDKNIIQKIVGDINKVDAFLYIVGPDIQVPFTIKNADDVNSWMKDLEIDKNNQHLTIIKDIISEIRNCVVCDYKLGIHLFFAYKNWGGTQPWQVPLALGTKIKLPAQTMKILNEGLRCKLTGTQGHFGATIWIDAEDESTEIDRENVINGIKRHGKFVPIPDNKMFQVQNPRSFSVLCFTDSNNVPEYIMRGEGCYCVLPNGSPKNNEAVNILIDCLAKQNKYVIARRVYNANFIPRIVGLIPQPNYNPKCFFLVPLPFADDIRYKYQEKDVRSAPSTDIVKEVYDYLDNINIEGDGCVKKVPLGITMMKDINTEKIINKAADKCFEKYLKLEEVEIDYLAESGSSFDDLKNQWPEREIREPTKKEKDDNNDSSDNDFDW